MYFVLALSSKALSSLVYLATFLLVVVVGIKTSFFLPIFLGPFFFSKRSYEEFLPTLATLPSTIFVIRILLIFYLYVLKLSFLRKIAD